MSETFSGVVRILDAQSREVFRFTSSSAVLRVGAEGNEGDIRVRDGEGREVLIFNSEAAVLRVGETGNEGDVRVRNAAGVDVIRLDGESGDIRLVGADCAEDFDIATGVTCEPGAVMVLDDTGRLTECSQPHDRKVVGVVSGAGGYRPGIVMDSQPNDNPRATIAIMGKVACHADAEFGAIEVGDLLTTSGTPGHAMKAGDLHECFGAIVGKAMSPLADGRGLVNMLISMQ